MSGRRLFLALLVPAAAIASVLFLVFPPPPPEIPERVWAKGAPAPLGPVDLHDIRGTPRGERVAVEVAGASYDLNHPGRDRIRFGSPGSFGDRFWRGDCNRRRFCYHPTGAEVRVGSETWREFRRAGTVGSLWWLQWRTCEGERSLVWVP